MGGLRSGIVPGAVESFICRQVGLEPSRMASMVRSKLEQLVPSTMGQLVPSTMAMSTRPTGMGLEPRWVSRRATSCEEIWLKLLHKSSLRSSLTWFRTSPEGMAMGTSSSGLVRRGLERTMAWRRRSAQRRPEQLGRRRIHRERVQRAGTGSCTPERRLQWRW